MKRWTILLLLLVAVALAASWWASRPEPLPRGFAAGNGRIEATEIDIATQSPGRIAEIRVREGDYVQAGAVLARMDTEVLRAQLAEAEARVREAELARVTSRSTVAQRQSERVAAEALVAQYRAESEAAGKRLRHSRALVGEGAVSRQQLDDDRARVEAAEAMIRAAEARVMAARAAVAAAESQIPQAQSVVDAARATVDRLQAEIGHAELRSPRAGRVQYRIAEPGEVLPAGGRVLSLVDLADVYMTFFLPTEAAGRLALDGEARLVLDALPDDVIPARISFVASVAQFTPKTVETAQERMKLMFRVRARIDPEWLQAHLDHVKVGLPGMAYVRLDPDRPWPERLAVRLPP